MEIIEIAFVYIVDILFLNKKYLKLICEQKQKSLNIYFNLLLSTCYYQHVID